MENKKYFIIYILYIAIGALLIGLCMAGIVDEFWNGMGSALLVIGVLRLLRMYRLRNNSVYRERVETAANDERNKFIRGKAWAWTGYVYVITAAIASIVLKIMEQEILSLAAAYSVCFVMIVFWISYMLLNKKY